MPQTVKPSERLQKLFQKTKIVCFGRYALEVPQEAELNWGEAVFDGSIDTITGGLDASKKRVASDIEEIKLKNSTFDITFNDKGPIENSWQIRYFPSESSKEYNLHFFHTYINKGDLTFILDGSIDDGDTEAIAVKKHDNIVKSLRLRDVNETPNDPGYCIEHAFLKDNAYANQERISIGIHLPSLPDVAFSISSNKNAYGDYSPAEFEKSVRKSLSLLVRINDAKKEQGIHYPDRGVMREGVRDVQHWHGEESLIKRDDGTHDFEWAFVGTPGDVANPSEYNVVMYSKVKYNLVGGADSSSVSDDEAVALWDRLLSGLKFRVKVPGSPPGSYYSLPSNQ